MARRRLVLSVLTASIGATVVAAGLAVPAATGSSLDPASAGPDRSAPALARERLVDDATGSATVRGDDGVVRFVGTDAGEAIENPAVEPTTPLRAAADAHLARYGAALGAERPGTELVRRPTTTRTVAGQDVVRYDQRVDGVPVIAGQVSLSLRPDRELGSATGDLSAVRTTTPATVRLAGARTTARGMLRRAAGPGPARVSSSGRWLFDPAVLGVEGRPARTVWRLEASRGPGVRRLVLVDDHTGGVLLDLDLVQELDRVVCDNGNVVRTTYPLCSSGFARTEGGAASAVTDVNLAYDLSGATSDFYDEVGDLDLTDLIGITVGGERKLASTVRFCLSGYSCPLANAFWSGQQMYYGQGYAGADDVVGHEMTHGVIDQYSELFYWGQSGAMNESLADIMGEILDHRHPSSGDSATDWGLGEDIPGFPDGIRNLADPTVFGQPDRMTSALWEPDTSSYGDSGGVHTNSGVGNKTAYLISQGGTFNGHTVPGIDGADTGLTKTAVLFLDVLQSLVSGSEYADLGRQLDQSCQDLLGAGTASFTSADCTSVHEAGLATELAETPTQAPQPDDAPRTCPGGTQLRVLLTPETESDPADAFDADGVWDYGSDNGPNATSGRDSWFAADLDENQQDSLALAEPVALPPGQDSYLWFRHWRLLDYGNGQFWDVGTVEIDDGADLVAAEDLDWVNGPADPVTTASDNPAEGRVGFGGDSLGWITSRLDLSDFAGDEVVSQFTLNSDGEFGFIGWWLDDIEVYTCDPALDPRVPTVTGTARVGGTLTAKPGDWGPSSVGFDYHWLRDGDPIGGATRATYRPVAADVGTRLSVEVTGQLGEQEETRTSDETAPVARGRITPHQPTVSGTPKVGAPLTARAGSWRPAGVRLAYQWLRGGKRIKGATAKTYRPKAADRGAKVSVRVTGTKPGYAAASATSKGVRVRS